MRKLSHLRAQILACYLGNFMGGFCIALWVPLIPFIQQKFDLSSMEVGNLVFSFGFGAVSGMFTSGMLTEKFGVKLTYIFFSIVLSIAIISLSFIPPFIYVIAPIVILFGFSVGGFEVCISVYGAYLEKKNRLFLMSPLHAAYSSGEFLGAIYVLLMLFLNFKTYTMTIMVVTVLYFCTFFFINHIQNIPKDNNQKSSSTFVIPRGAVIFFSLIVAFTYIVGGAMVDWSSLYITQVAKLDVKYAASGYLVVNCFMLICRIYGSKIVKSFGPFKTAYFGAILLSSGLILVVLFDNLITMYLGFICIGIGMSNISPLTMSATTRQNDMPLIPAISIVSICGYTGMLLAPAFLGFIGHLLNLSAIFLTLATLCLISSYLIFKTKIYFR